jgi:hypothetical protein
MMPGMTVADLARDFAEAISIADAQAPVARNVRSGAPLS